MADDRHLEKSIFYNFVVGGSIGIKFGRPMKNDMPMTINKSKSKPEVDFLRDGRLFAETGSSNISAVD